MADALTNISNFINSPPGELAAGAVMAGIVWKFFEKVEDVLSEDTKLEIAIWLVGVEVGQKVGLWPNTFAKVFDRVFSTKHWSWKCFYRSCCASFGVFALTICAVLLMIEMPLTQEKWSELWSEMKAASGPLAVFGWITIAPDYVSLLKTRYLIAKMSQAGFLHRVILLVLDALLTPLISLVGSLAGFLLLSLVPLAVIGSETDYLSGGFGLWFVLLIVVPTLASGYFTSLWLWLYCLSGLILKAARRFDKTFQWFNSIADIEHKPLSAIGLVAGALVAVLWWAVVIVKWIV